MTTKTILGLSSAFFVLALFVSPIGVAAAMGDFLTIVESELEVDDGEVSAEIKTDGKIPKKGEAALGYGIVTDGGDIIVATTHAGVLDSEDQRGKINSPKWHNHYVTLGENDAVCGEGNPIVINLSYESPGEVKVKGKSIEISDVSLGEDIETRFGLAPNTITSFTTGNPIGVVASFTLSPVFDSNGLTAVCVTDLTPVTVDEED